MNNLTEFLWEQWHPEAKVIANSLKELLAKESCQFPENGKLMNVSKTQGVYIIRKNRTVLHVGRTYGGREGLHQRLKNHLNGASSFVIKYLKRNKEKLRKKGYTYQLLRVRGDKKRAYLENLATGILHPEYIGTGRKKQHTAD